VRLVMLANQCTGQEQDEGEQDNGLRNDTDCNASERAATGQRGAAAGVRLTA
jgi:hypothetical protein